MMRRTLIVVTVWGAVLASCSPVERTPEEESAASPAPESAAEPVAAPAGIREIDHLALLPRSSQPFEGVLAGGQPTLEQLQAIRSAGYRSAINLRSHSEPGPGADEIEALGLAYTSIPIAGAADLTEENVASFAAAFDAAERPLLLYCGSSNRVGALLALKALYLDGMEPQAALELGLAAGLTRLEPDVRRLLGL